jgi:hypothetical protein
MTFDSDGKDNVSIAQAINLLITVPHVGESWKQGSSNDEMFQRSCKSDFPIVFIMLSLSTLCFGELNSLLFQEYKRFDDAGIHVQYLVSKTIPSKSH